jgi:hypothetical protein
MARSFEVWGRFEVLSLARAPDLVDADGADAAERVDVFLDISFAPCDG